MSENESADYNSQAAWLEAEFSYNPSQNVWSPRSDMGEFGYSDGDENEEYLLAKLKSVTDRSVMSSELSEGMKDWPSTYHLHHQRCNVFRPIADCFTGPILEIGAGCGVLTRYLGELGHSVYALEGSQRRSSIIGERCRDLQNVQVINCNFQDFNPEKKFKTITLIGVLEYARVYFGSAGDSDAVDQMLFAVSKILEPDGVLVLAIENKLGLKYFAGYSEDHFGKPMFGIEDRYGPETIATFGRAELEQRLKNSGLENVEFAYAFPDYKFPQAVLFEPATAQPYASQLASLVAAANASDRQKPDLQHFSMSGAVKSVMENGLGGELANSFIVMARKSNVVANNSKNDLLAIHYGSGNRKNAYLKTVTFRSSPDGMRVFRALMTDHHQESTDRFTLVLEDENFCPGVMWTDQLQKLVLDENWQIGDLKKWSDTWIDALLKELKFEANNVPNKRHEIPSRLFDALPKNLVVTPDGKTRFIDLEWRSKEPIEFGYLFYRGIADSLKALEIVAHRDQQIEIGQIVVSLGTQLGLDFGREDVERYFDRELDFQNSISRVRVSDNPISFLNIRQDEYALRRYQRRYRRKQRRKFKLSQSFLGRLFVN